MVSLRHCSASLRSLLLVLLSLACFASAWSHPILLLDAALPFFDGGYRPLFVCLYDFLPVITWEATISASSKELNLLTVHEISGI